MVAVSVLMTPLDPPPGSGPDGEGEKAAETHAQPHTPLLRVQVGGQRRTKLSSRAGADGTLPESCLRKREDAGCWGGGGAGSLSFTGCLALAQTHILLGVWEPSFAGHHDSSDASGPLNPGAWFRPQRHHRLELPTHPWHLRPMAQPALLPPRRAAGVGR